jgi:tetratricopeptide (TPR) repeat protein
VKKLSVCLLAALGLSTLCAAAPSLTVSYLEGAAWQSSASSWRDLAIGDAVAADGRVRLDAGACLQLNGNGPDIVLTQKGTYVIADLLAVRKRVDAAGSGRSVITSIALLLAGASKDQSTVLGARGNDQSGSDDSGWVESSVQDTLQQANDLIRLARYEEALSKLAQASDEAVGDEAAQVNYYRACAYSQKGDARNASKCITAAVPASGASWAADYLLLRARILVDTFAYAQAIDCLASSRETIGRDAQRAPLYFYLLGLAFRGAGDTAGSRESLQQVIAISGGSDLGKSATALLQEP